MDCKGLWIPLYGILYLFATEDVEWLEKKLDRKLNKWCMYQLSAFCIFWMILANI